MEEKSILLSCSRGPESTGTYRGDSVFRQSCDWLPQDLRTRIAETLQEDGSLSIVDWLKQIRFHCVGDFCDVVELSRDADSVVSEEIDRLNLFEEQRLVGVPYPNEAFISGGCDKHLMQFCSEDGEAHDVTCSESGSRLTLSCRSSDGDDSFEQDSNSFTGFFGLGPYLQEVEEILKDVPAFENREDLFATLPVKQLNRATSLSAISEGSDEVFFPDDTDDFFQPTDLEIDECTMNVARKRSDVNLIFDDGVNKPVAPMRRRNRDPEYCTMMAGDSCDSRCQDFARNRCAVDTLKPQEHVQSVAGSCRSLVDIPKAIDIENQDSNANAPQVRLRPHAAASFSPKIIGAVDCESECYDNLGFDDSQNEKNPEDLLLINRASQSTKLRRHSRNNSVRDEVARLSRNSIDDCELAYKTLPLTNSDRLYKKNTISEVAVRRSEISLNSVGKWKMDANKSTVALKIGGSLSHLNDHERDTVSGKVHSGDRHPEGNLEEYEAKVLDADGAQENMNEFSYEMLADEKLEAPGREFKNSGSSDDERMITDDSDGLTRSHFENSGLNESEKFVGIEPHNKNPEVPTDDDGLLKKKPIRIPRKVSSDVGIFSPDNATIDTSNGTANINEDIIGKSEIPKVELSRIDNDGLAVFNPQDSGVDPNDVETVSSDNATTDTNNGPSRINENSIENSEIPEVELPRIDNEGLEVINPLDSGVDPNDVEMFSPDDTPSNAIVEDGKFAKLEINSHVNQPPINPEGFSRMNPFKDNILSKDVEISSGRFIDIIDTREMADSPSPAKVGGQITKVVIDEEGVSRVNSLDKDHKPEDVEFLSGSVNIPGGNAKLPNVLIDREGLSKANPLRKNHNFEHIESLEGNVYVPEIRIDGDGISGLNALERNHNSKDAELLGRNFHEGNAEILNVPIDEQGVHRGNALERSYRLNDVESLPNSRGSMEVNFSRSPNSIRSIDNSEENLRWIESSELDVLERFNSPEDALSTYDNFGSLDSLEDPIYDDVTPTNITDFELAENVPLGDDPEQPTKAIEKPLHRVVSAPSMMNSDDSYYEKFDNSKTFSEYSDGNKEDRFESLDSEKSFHTALDKISPTRSEYENSSDDFEVIDGKIVGASQEEPAFTRINDCPERLYVNFPLKGNIENPEMVTSTPNKPVRKHLNVNTDLMCPGSNSRSAELQWHERKAADVPIHKSKTMPDLSVHQRTQMKANRIETNVFETVEDVCRMYRDRKGSNASDIAQWKNCLWDSLVADEEGVGQWFSSNDAEGKIYFFEENSNESSWVLPNIIINKSNSTIATPNATPPYHEVEVRTSSASEKARVGKTRSMVLINQSAVSREIATRKSGSMPRDWPQLFDGNMCVLKEGSLNRTKITENGKKLRKNWSTSHVVLTELFLLFFKDAKTFAAMKTGQSATAKPDISVDLNGALVEPGERASSRKNVYIISTVLGLQVLIQSENAALATDWYQQVRTAISHLPSGSEAHTKVVSVPERPRDTSSKIFLDTNSPEENKKLTKIGRSRSVKIKRPEGSLEDLSSSAAERQTRIKAKLRKFFQRRPTMDSLVKNGIYKDEPAFGSYLEDVCPAEPPRVPRFVRACIEILENNLENMRADGLYRASGNLSQIQKIRLQVDQNNLDILGQEEDVHVLTGALKLFFRELKEPLIPFAFFEKALNASMSKKRNEKVQCFREIVKALPPPNYDTLQFLLQHLLRVTSYQEHNRMHIPNLAIVFGPTLMWPLEESANMALDLMQQNLVIECFLSEYDKIFK